jgi:hypothetical protein
MSQAEPPVPDTEPPVISRTVEPIFEDEAPTAPPVAPLPSVRTRPPTPWAALGEAIGWTFGVFAAHLFATVVLLVGLFVGLWCLNPAGGLPLTLDDPQSPYLMLLIGGDQMLVLLISGLAVRLALGRDWRRRLNFSSLHPLHAVLILGLMLPLSCLSSENYRLAQRGWSALVELWPILGLLDGGNSVEWLQQIAANVPLWLMVIAVGVGPALSEELIFRGMIGRKLVASWGLWPGVLITSCLFGVVHFHPCHVVAVIPLGVAMHLIYLATKTLWGPILLHFLNNSWATLAAQWSPAPGTESAAHEGTKWWSAAVESSPQMALGLLVASGVAVIVLGTLLHHTRTRYLLADGDEWTPGYLSVEQPPRDVPYRRDHGLSSRRTLMTAATAWLAFAIAFIAELTAFAR